MVLSVAIALATVWAAIALSYLTNLPIGFYVGGLGAVNYATVRVFKSLATHRWLPRPGC
jgi:zinc/manganese transport system permease protein